MKMMLIDPSGLLAEMLSLSSLLILVKVIISGRVGGTVVVGRMGISMSLGITGFGFLENIPLRGLGNEETTNISDQALGHRIFNRQHRKTVRTPREN